MSLPRSLLDAPLADLDLELRSGAWPDGPGGRGLRLDLRTGHRPDPRLLRRRRDDPPLAGSRHPRRAARPVRLAAPGARHPDPPPAARPGPTCGRPAASGGRRRSASPTRPTPHPCPGTAGCSPRGTPAAPSRSTPFRCGSSARSGSVTGGATTSSAPPCCRCSPRQPTPPSTPSRDCLWSDALAPAHRRGARHPLGRRRPTTVRRWPLAGVTLPQSMHTVAQTRDWLVLVDCAFRRRSRRGARRWRAHGHHVRRRARLAVRKDDLEAAPDGTPVAPGHAPPRPRAEPLLRRVGRPRRRAPACSSTRPTPTWPWRCGSTTSTPWAARSTRACAALHPPDGARAGRRGGARPRDRRVIDRARLHAGPSDCWATQLSAMDWSLDALAAPTVHHMLFTGYRPGGGHPAGTRASTPTGSTRPACRPRTCPPAWSPSSGPACAARADWSFGLDDYPTSPVLRPPARRRAPAATTAGCWCRCCNDDGFRVDVFDAGDVGAGPVAVLAARAGPPCRSSSTRRGRRRPRPAPDGERLRFADDLTDRPAGGAARRPRRHRAATWPATSTTTRRPPARRPRVGAGG